MEDDRSPSQLHGKNAARIGAEAAIVKYRSVSEETLSRPVTIVIPAYGAAERLAVCLQSLSDYAPERADIFVVDDCTPNESIRETCARANAEANRFQYVRRPENRGFVDTCNWGFEHLRPQGSDLLLLNSDTEVTANFLLEMQQVLNVDEKHGAVCPRSNNATLFSIPPVGTRLEASEAYTVWNNIRDKLPRFHVVPTAVGFCMLIKSTVLDYFGRLFDPVYSPGYNEENDFICRINQYGYSAVSANHAFVYHYESSSFSSRRRALEERNRRILDARYPEYGRKVRDYFDLYIDPIEYFAALTLPHRPRLLVDLSHLPAAYNGTAEYALNLLRELGSLNPPTYDLHVGVQPGPGSDFFARELRGYRTYEYGISEHQTFDLVFKPAQFFTTAEFNRINRLAPRIAFNLQDIIGVRCEYLNSAYRRELFLITAELSDFIFTISDYSRRDFRSYYGIDLPMTVIHHGTDVGLGAVPTDNGDYVLVIGNSYAHKAVPEALEHLGNDIPIVVLGASDQCPVRPNIQRYPSGQIPKQKMRSLYAHAKAIIYPSQYEGFGLPVVDGLAMGKPVIVPATEINRELAATLRDDRLYLISGYNELLPAIQTVTNGRNARLHQTRLWSHVATDYNAALQRMISTGIDFSRLRQRWKTLSTIAAISAEAIPVPVTQAPVWRRLGGRVRRTIKTVRRTKR